MGGCGCDADLPPAPFSSSIPPGPPRALLNKSDNLRRSHPPLPTTNVPARLQRIVVGLQHYGLRRLVAHDHEERGFPGGSWDVELLCEDGTVTPHARADVALAAPGAEQGADLALVVGVAGQAEELALARDPRADRVRHPVVHGGRRPDERDAR